MAHVVVLVETRVDGEEVGYSLPPNMHFPTPKEAPPKEAPPMCWCDDPCKVSSSGLFMTLW